MSDAGRPCGDPRAGFTLIEMTVALLVVALAATLALPFLRPNETRSGLRAKAYEAAALLRLDRAAAQRLGRTVTDRMSFPGPHLVSGSSGSAVDLSRGLLVRARDGAQGYSFHPDGTSSGGAITLATRAHAFKVTIDETTSAVTVVSLSTTRP